MHAFLKMLTNSIDEFFMHDINFKKYKIVKYVWYHLKENYLSNCVNNVSWIICDYVEWHKSQDYVTAVKKIDCMFCMFNWILMSKQVSCDLP